MSADRRAGEDFVDSVDEIQKRLPERWQLATLGNVIRGFETGRNFQAAGVPAKAGETGVLKISAVTWGRFDPSANKALLPGSEPLPHERIKAGDLLISRANTTELVGAPVLVEQDYPNLMLPDKILRVLYDSELVDPRFLLQALRSKEARSHIEENATGSSDSMRNLSQPKLREIPIPVPPLPEQKRIADKLDRLLARVDACRERLDRVPALLKRFRQSVLAAATSGELTREWREERKRSLDEWQSCRVRQIVNIKNGRSFPSSDYGDHGVRLLRPGNLHMSGRVEWNASNTRHLPTQYAEEFPDFVLGKGELLMNLTAQSLKDEFLGRVCLKSDDQPALLNQRICAFYPAIDWDVRPYLFLYFKSPVFRRYVDTLDGGTLIKHMHSKQLLEHEFALPPSDEAEEIRRRADALLESAEQLERRLGQVDCQSSRISGALLAKAFRGELVPQDPTDEPAAALLARIAATHDDAGAPAKKRRRSSMGD